MIDIDDIIDSKEVAKMLHVGRNRIYQLCDDALLPYYKRPGVGIFFLRTEILEWLADGRIVRVQDAIHNYFRKYRNVNGNKKADSV